MTEAAGRALVIQAPGRVVFVESAVPSPAHGEVVIDVHAVGVCGSDRELWCGTRPEGFVRYPIVPGHEWSGTVRAIGAGVDRALLGRAVVGEGFRNCQTCRACRAGNATLCESDYAETGFTEPGAMADTLTLPARLVHVLPEGSDLTAAALLEPAACAAAAAAAAEVLPGDRVAVVGIGTLGALTLQLLAARSPGTLTAVGLHEAHRARAERCGATSYTT
ncbi:alcohol dehydrogenase catalytic domain-containing protein, partial [Nocardia salmonicida]